MSKSVVTGGLGFIGSHLVDRLLKEGHEVLVIDNCSTGRPENLKHHHTNPKLTVHVSDISSSEVNLVELFGNAEYIYHLAALADIVPSIQNPVSYYQSNVFGTLRVLEAAKTLKNLKKIVYSASSSCYGIPDQYPTPESSEIRTEYPYALTKRMGEELLLHWGKVYKLPVISLRFFNVYGPRSRTSGTYGAVFGVFLAQKLANKPYTVVGDGNQSRDFTYVTDVVNAVWMASQSTIVQDVFNVGSSRHEKINRLVELLGGDKTYIPKRPGEPDCTFADISKIQKALGWKPEVPLVDGVRAMMEKIDYWKDAPVWTADSIAKATEDWFAALSK